jgi:signal peptidase I
MLNFFLPSKTKQVLAESQQIFESLKRNRIYTQDTLSPRNLEAVLALEARYPALLKARDLDALQQLNKEAMKFGNKVFPPSAWDGWRENVEVFVVAAIMALSIRTFFLQPFKIPTGSMEPTLYGIEPQTTDKLPPNVVYQVYDFLIHGRTYSRVVTEHGGKITGLKPGSFTIWFEYTDVYLQDDQGNTEVKRIWIRPSDVEQKLGLYPYGDSDLRDHHEHDEIYKPGDVLANYVTQTGDQVLVDKVTYNFRSPRRGEVFIFKTAGIADLANERGPDQEGSEDFIKRCVGLAGDIIEVKPPFLYVNKQLASGAPSFQKEFDRAEYRPGDGIHYPGYSLVDPFASDFTGFTQGGDPNKPFNPFASDVSQTYYVPADSYWAMGDNSPNSKDSRYWGGVPRQNLVGRGYFVFWPFTERWGFMR